MATVKINAEEPIPNQPIVWLSEVMAKEMGNLKNLIKTERDQLTERTHIKQIVTFLFNEALTNPDNVGFDADMARVLKNAPSDEEKAKTFIRNFTEMTDKDAFELYRKLKSARGEIVTQDQNHFVEKLLDTMGRNNGR